MLVRDSDECIVYERKYANPLLSCRERVEKVFVCFVISSEVFDMMDQLATDKKVRFPFFLIISADLKEK